MIFEQINGNTRLQACAERQAPQIHQSEKNSPISLAGIKLPDNIAPLEEELGYEIESRRAAQVRSPGYV